MTTPAEYVERLRKEHATGKATEHSYRDSLKALLEAVEKGLTVINEPRRTKIGAPDYQIERNGVTLGVIEAKDVDEDLDRLDRRSQAQLLRYTAELPNLIHTNYLHFRWYIFGELKQEVRIAELREGKLHPLTDGFTGLAGMLQNFVATTAPTLKSPEELAERMAGMARQIASLITAALPDSETLKSQLAAFEQTLIPNLSHDDFADMYAQTLAYGLFAARVEYKGDIKQFTLHNAFWSLPQTNPFLRRFFQEIAPELDDRVRWQVDILANLLAHADIDEILRDFGKRTRQEDPVVHFYETFLKQYDPAKREQRGVYYTPEPVVSYIVRSVDHVIRSKFKDDRGKAKDGLADKNTLVLDPATGTGTFLYHVIRHIYQQVVEINGDGGLWQQYVNDNLLPRLFGFELLMAPYAVAHMKLGLLLRDTLRQTNNTQEFNKRLGVYLTNTLEETIKEHQSALDFSGFISDEANRATAIKRDKPIMVVLGNPPYSVHGANKGRWIIDRLRDYYFVDGQPLGERNSKLLQDDYVKFIRFGQWRIHQTGSGILAFVTNHGFLDNLTFRGMRQQLLNEFSEIYILNLHGNTKKKEKAPDGNRDDNVFEIQQGVAISIFVKIEGQSAPAKIYYADLWGTRKAKYDRLNTTDLSNTAWKELTPQKPFYLFIPQNGDLLPEYQAGWKISDVFGIESNGVKTHRDHFVVDFDADTLKKRISEFANLNVQDDVVRKNYGLKDTNAWKLHQQRIILNQDNSWSSRISDYFYRPFDYRYISYHSAVIDRAREDVMRHMLNQDNPTLVTSRGVEIGRGFEHVLCCTTLADHHSVSLKEANYVFPLYVYPVKDKARLLDAEGDYPPGKDGRTPNLSPKFVRELESRLKMQFCSDGHGDLTTTFGPEDVFHYTYAVFHSPTYRERYAEFLKIDFPRLPLTSDADLFRDLCGFGEKLVDAHLLRADFSGQPRAKFPVTGDSVVASGYPKYTSPPASLPEERGVKEVFKSPSHHGEGVGGEVSGRIHINRTQYFEGVEPDVWEFHVGGYQVLDKWLKDRRGRVLTSDEMRHYREIILALRETIRLMDAIDERIPAWPVV